MVGGCVKGLYSDGGEHAEAAVAASVMFFFGAGMAQLQAGQRAARPVVAPDGQPHRVIHLTDMR